MGRMGDRRLPGETSGKIRVLHVDDSSEFADLTASFLRRSDVSVAVTTSTNPENALERFREETFDCVVSDYDMAGLSGLELLEAVRLSTSNAADAPFGLSLGVHVNLKKKKRPMNTT